MSHNPTENYKNIYFNGKKYQIRKSNTYFGSYDTLKEAIEYKNLLMKHNWSTKYIKYAHDPDLKHIYKSSTNKFVIYKKLENGVIYFGSYDTLKEARKWRDFFRNHDWNRKYLKERYGGVALDNKNKRDKDVADHNIYYDNGTFVITKYINGKTIRFGSFKNIESARVERDILEKCKWNYEEYLELIDLY